MHRLAAIVLLLGPVLGGCAPDVPADCIIDGAAAVSVVRRDSPVAALHDWHDDVLAIRNLDVVDWPRVDVAIAGVGRTGSAGRPATGRYVSDEQKAVPRGALVGFRLLAFENSRGSRWMPAAMHATTAELTFARGGGTCHARVLVADPGA